MFAELKLEIAERGTATQKCEVASLEAEVIEVDEDSDRYVVSVRFKGVIRDDADNQDESFDEVWHLMKSRQGNGGWVLAGIQQS
jgi:predicted lipid-binding transport protein (Tim44 family)